MGDIQNDDNCPSPSYHDGAWLSWAWLSTSLPMGSGELIPWFALPLCAAAHKSSFLVPAVGLQAFKTVTGLIGMFWVQSIGVSAGELLIGSSCACWGLGSLQSCAH